MLFLRIPTGLFLVLWLSTPALAVDGVLEINQTCAVNTGCFSGDTAGFPVTITQRGSYRLTGDLLVATDVGGLVVIANDVSLDLNGFLIDGPSLCAPIACPTGSSDGIGAASALVGQRVSVRNGTLTGFSGSCVSLSALAHISDLSIQSCGGVGIEVGIGSIVLANRVANVGEEALKLGTSSTFAHNVLLDSGLSNPAVRAVSGGSPSAGNVCEDGSCTRRGERRYYLTMDTFDGAGADARNSCAPGFHFASLFEIVNPSVLRYDTSLGQTGGDSGEGPFHNLFGWIRVGRSPVGGNTAGSVSCLNWTSGNNADFGTAVKPPGFWANPAERASPWEASARNCNIPTRVWCVED